MICVFHFRFVKEEVVKEEVGVDVGLRSILLDPRHLVTTSLKRCKPRVLGAMVADRLTSTKRTLTLGRSGGTYTTKPNVERRFREKSGLLRKLKDKGYG